VHKSGGTRNEKLVYFWCEGFEFIEDLDVAVDQFRRMHVFQSLEKLIHYKLPIPKSIDIIKLIIIPFNPK
jgi:hypothetical protein